jgi:hypothetical protein
MLQGRQTGKRNNVIDAVVGTTLHCTKYIHKLLLPEILSNSHFYLNLLYLYNKVIPSGYTSHLFLLSLLYYT